MKRFPVYIILAAVLFCSAPSAAQLPDEPVAKTFRVRYKTVAEFEQLVKTMLSNRGKIKTSPELNMIVVVDRPAYLSSIESLFRDYDRPAQQFMVTIQLILGSNDPKAVPAADSTALHEMLDPYYYYRYYEELDRVVIRTEEKTVTSFDLAESRFNVSLDVDYISGAQRPVRFRSLVLNEYTRDVGGKYLKPVYAASVQMEKDVREILAAVKLESAGKTLILIVSVSPL